MSPWWWVASDDDGVYIYFTSHQKAYTICYTFVLLGPVSVDTRMFFHPGKTPADSLNLSALKVLQ